MIRKRVTGLACAAALLLPLASAQAGVWIGIGVPPYHRHHYRPVYVVPGPAYVVQPAPVVVQPAPVYVQPAPAAQGSAYAPAAAPPAPVAPVAPVALPPQPVPVGN